MSSLLNACLHLDIRVRLCCERWIEHECPEYMGAVLWRVIKECDCFLTEVGVRELTCERWNGAKQRRGYLNKES